MKITIQLAVYTAIISVVIFHHTFVECHPEGGVPPQIQNKPKNTTVLDRDMTKWEHVMVFFNNYFYAMTRWESHGDYTVADMERLNNYTQGDWFFIFLAPWGLLYVMVLGILMVAAVFKIGMESIFGECRVNINNQNPVTFHSPEPPVQVPL